MSFIRDTPLLKGQRMVESKKNGKRYHANIYQKETV